MIQQLPPASERVVYTGTGQHLPAARINDPRAVFGHLLYWAAASSVEEARYLTAVLNAPVLSQLVAPLEARGEHNPRHFDKYVWRLPIPLFDAAEDSHAQLVQLAVRAEEVAATVDVSGVGRFEMKRRRVREALEADGVSGEVDVLVHELLAPEFVRAQLRSKPSV